MIKVKRYGWIPDHPDRRDLRMQPLSIVGLPPVMDLRAKCPPIFDQGDLGSCTANAIVAAHMMASSKFDPDAPPQPMLSRLFLYWCERALEGSVETDSGAMIRDGFKVIAKTGLCLEDTWPYVIAGFARKPDEICWQEAEGDKAVVYMRVDQELPQMRAMLAQEVPIVVGFTVYESFESDAVAHSGEVPMPGVDEAVLGGHAVLVVGYDDAKGRFLVRNSWGLSWGQQGYFTMPYEYLTDHDLADDFWAVTKIT